MSDENSEFILYHYTPTRVGAGVFAALFCTGLITLTFFLFYFAKNSNKRGYKLESTYKSDTEILIEERVSTISSAKNFGKYIPLLVGCLMEAVGYIARAISSSDTSALVPYIIQSVLLLVAPSLMAATIYMLFGRMLVLLRCKSLSIVPSRFSTTIFVTGDILSFFLQAAGGGLMSQEGSTSIGSNLIVAGLFVQIAFFGLFLITELRFVLQVNEVSTVLGHGNSWKFLNWTLIITSFLILGRSIVRVVEFIQGFEGYIITREYFIYVFDAVPMFMVILMFTITIPSGNMFKLERKYT